MKKTSILVATIIGISWLAVPPYQVAAGNSQRIRKLQAEARAAELNAQAAAATQAAYEQAWQRTHQAARNAVCAAQFVYSPTPQGAWKCLQNLPANKIERKPNPGYQSIPRIQPPSLRRDFGVTPKR